jgi:hypothetical protein
MSRSNQDKSSTIPREIVGKETAQEFDCDLAHPIHSDRFAPRSYGAVIRIALIS